MAVRVPLELALTSHQSCAPILLLYILEFSLLFQRARSVIIIVGWTQKDYELLIAGWTREM